MGSPFKLTRSVAHRAASLLLLRCYAKRCGDMDMGSGDRDPSRGGVMVGAASGCAAALTGAGTSRTYALQNAAVPTTGEPAAARAHAFLEFGTRGCQQQFGTLQDGPMGR
jgi:hypothetical protein